MHVYTRRRRVILLVKGNVFMAPREKKEDPLLTLAEVAKHLRVDNTTFQGTRALPLLPVLQKTRFTPKKRFTIEYTGASK
jgi:hypothetical protein